MALEQHCTIRWVDYPNRNKQYPPLQSETVLLV